MWGSLHQDSAPCPLCNAGIVDKSKVYVALLLPPSELLAVPATPSAVKDYLNGWHGMKVPVTQEFYASVYPTDQSLAEDKLARTDGSMLPVSRHCGLLASLLVVVR